MTISFMQISPAKAVLALALVEQRVTWLETKRIEQWARSHYLSRYNLAYFENAARLGRLWGLFEDSRLVASAVLLDEDPRWQDYEKPPRGMYITWPRRWINRGPVLNFYTGLK